MNTSFFSRHRIVRIAVIATGTLALCSGGAYALASTSGGTTAAKAPISHRANGRYETVTCPMISATGHHVKRVCRVVLTPVFRCRRHEMCHRPCAVWVSPPAGTGRTILNPAMRVGCVVPPVINPGGPMIPAGSVGVSGSGSAAGSPPAFTSSAR
jgi:hypothetical protein